jgi:arylsulfatase A-like enzyme
VTANWTWSSAREALRLDSRRAFAAVAGGGSLAALAGLWPGDPGVVLSSFERLSIVAALGACGLGVAMLAALAAGPRREAPAAPLLLPIAVALALACAPRSGRIHVHVDEGWLWLVGVAATAAALSFRTKAAPWIAGLLAGWLLVGGLVAWPDHIDARGRPEPGPDILLLTLDTVRGDHFDFSAGDLPVAQTPYLSALAQESVVFTQAFSTAALTGPAHAAMLTGLDSPGHGARANGDPVDEALAWAPELLARAGWRTRGLVSASVLDASVGFARGFEAYDSTYERRRVRGHGLVSFLGYRPHKGSAHHRAGGETLALLDGIGEGPRSFVWIHLYDAHWPYEPSGEAAARHGLDDATPLPAALGGPFAQTRRGLLTPELIDRGKRLYRAGIDDLDRIVGALLARVPCETIVVVVGDHGESLDEHDLHFGHGKHPYAPDVRVPLMVRAPGWAPGVVDAPVSLIDVAPTLLELAELPVPASMLGRSLARPDGRPVVSHCYSEGFVRRTDRGEPTTDDLALGPFGGIAVRDERWSAIHVLGQPPALFDRRADPRELSPLPLPEDHPLAAVLAFERTRTGEEPEPLDPATLEMLRALGYVQ